MVETLDDSRLGVIVRFVVDQAIMTLAPDRVWLFGSHANNRANRSSDVDLAIELSDGSRHKWSAFVQNVSDGVPALVELDLIDLGRCEPRLANEIVDTGRVVYQRHPCP